MNIVIRKAIIYLFISLAVVTVELSAADNRKAAEFCTQIQSAGVSAAWAGALAFCTYGNQQGLFEYLNTNPVVFNEAVYSASTENMILAVLPFPLPLSPERQSLLSPIATQPISLITFFEQIKYKDLKTWLVELHAEAMRSAEAMRLSQCRAGSCGHRH